MIPLSHEMISPDVAEEEKVMSRFHQRLNKDLNDPEFAEAFYDMSVDIALLQVLEQARKALHLMLLLFLSNER